MSHIIFFPSYSQQLSLSSHVAITALSLLAAMEKPRDSSWENKDESVILYPPSSRIGRQPLPSCHSPSCISIHSAQSMAWWAAQHDYLKDLALGPALHGTTPPVAPYDASMSAKMNGTSLLTENQAAGIQSYSVTTNSSLPPFHVRDRHQAWLCGSSPCVGHAVLQGRHMLPMSQEQAQAPVRSNARRRAW